MGSQELVGAHWTHPGIVFFLGGGFGSQPQGQGSYYSSDTSSKCKTCMILFSAKQTKHLMSGLMSFHSALLISSPSIVTWEAVKQGVSPVGLSTYRQCTTVRPSPPLYSSCHLSTWRMSFRKERLDTGVSLYMGQPRNWNCCTIRYPSWGCRESGNKRGVERKQALFPGLNSSGLIPPTHPSGHEGRRGLPVNNEGTVYRPKELRVWIWSHYKKPWDAKNSPESRHTGKLPQHNKGHIWQTHSQHRSQWWKTETISSKITNKTRLPTLTTIIQHNFGSFSHSNQRRKK